MAWLNILDNNQAWPIQEFNGLYKLGSATQQLHSNNDCKKKGNLGHLKNWRSVALLCLDYKILSASLQYTAKIYEYSQRDRVSVSGKATEIKDTNCLDNYRVWLYLELLLCGRFDWSVQPGQGFLITVSSATVNSHTVLVTDCAFKNFGYDKHLFLLKTNEIITFLYLTVDKRKW